MKLRILLCTTNYYPEPTGIAIYTTDLARTIENAGSQLTVLTSLPHYPWWKIPYEFAHITEGTSHQNSIKVLRVRHYIPRKMNAYARIKFETSLWWNLRRIAKKLAGNDFDVVISCIPTVAAGLVGNRIAKKLGVPFGLIVQDLSGSGARQSGLRGGVLVSQVASAIEGFVLKSANSIVVVSPAMHDVVLNLGVDPTKVLQITNYSARNIEHLDKDLAHAEFGWPSD